MTMKKTKGKTNPEDQETEEIQINARQRLCNYLIDYCRRYSRRICQNDFIEIIPPEILLDNHLTLSRVLLEFSSHVIEFEPDDFARCYWLIWAPFFLPSLVGIEGKSCWQLITEKGIETDFIDAWKRLNLSSLLIVMTGSAFGQPPSWSSGIHMHTLVSRFLALKELISQFNNQMDIDLRTVTEPMNFGISKVNWDECFRIFERVSTYLPPARERLLPIFEWIRHKNDQALSQELVARIHQANLTDEFISYQNQPRPISAVITEPDDEGNIYCPRCGGALRKNNVTEINRGKLVLCSMSSDAWLFKSEQLPKTII